ncbi:hypothetical protein ACFV2Q_31540 [Streptomyces sp. NPDC059650]|uniref:hypothetical protein n=1 Tax=Streptomyces sp. NPDC059650 TaxID=3346896 RepID=UPI003696CB1C
MEPELDDQQQPPSPPSGWVRGPSPWPWNKPGRFADAFRARYPETVLDVVEIVSEGDRHSGPLSVIGEKGAFTRNADRYLLDGRVQATIACVKDVPGPHDRSPGISIGAVLPREDTRDALVLPAGHPAATLAELPSGTRVAGSSAGGNRLGPSLDSLIDPFSRTRARDAGWRWSGWRSRTPTTAESRRTAGAASQDCATRRSG